MRVAVYLPFVVSALLGACGPRLARTMRPSWAAVVLLAAGVAATLTAMSALALLAFTWIGQLPVVADTARWPRAVLRAHDPVATAVAVAATAVLAGVIVSGLRTAVRRTQTAIDARRTCRTLTGCGADLVVVADAEPTACAVGGRRGRIVVSTGMLAALGAAERRVLLAHERAHLDHRHDLYTALAAITAAANPLLGRLPAAVGLATERWADEVAATEVEDRRLAARALARAALAASRARKVRFAAFSHRDTAERVLALHHPPRRGGALVAAAATIAITVAVVGLVIAAHDVEHLFELAMHHRAP